ncbi:tail protein X [Sodalis sp. RH19]|uniref:tail protein X n=1 Tax=Sodalis sp. RH19 TaxID=3394334 RepID=UPI0039B60CE9
MKVRARQGDTVDALCWRHYGRTQAVVEQVFAANPGLAGLGSILPMGIAVELPDLAPAAVRETYQLWD